MRVNTYNDAGEVLESVVLCLADGQYGVDIVKNVWHGIVCLESGCVIFEVKGGAFVPHDKDGIPEIGVKSLWEGK